MNQRFLVSLAAIAVVVVCAFSLGLRAQPGMNAGAGPVRTLDEIDPGTPIYPGFGGGGGWTDGFNSVITLSAPGYYYLTQNLDVPSGMDGIHITSGGVQLDMRGFVVRGVAGSGYGVLVTNPLKANIIIRNGIITLMGNTGLDATYGRNMLIEKVASSANSGAGIAMFQGRIRDCVARGNGAAGFLVFQYSSLDSCSADTNNQQGFTGGGGNSFVDCTATGNQGIGLQLVSGTVSHCTLLNNNGGGISINNGTVLDSATNGNSAYGVSAGNGAVVRGCTASGSVTGILAVTGCSITGNTLLSCQTGISISGAGNRVEHNTLRGSSTGISSSVAGSFVFGNIFSTTTTPLSLTGSNFVGTVISSAGAITSTTSPICNFVQ